MSCYVLGFQHPKKVVMRLVRKDRVYLTRIFLPLLYPRDMQQITWIVSSGRHLLLSLMLTTYHKRQRVLPALATCLITYPPVVSIPLQLHSIQIVPNPPPCGAWKIMLDPEKISVSPVIPILSLAFLFFRKRINFMYFAGLFVYQMYSIF